MNAYHPHVNITASIPQAVLHAIAEKGINLTVMEVVALVCVCLFIIVFKYLQSFMKLSTIIIMH